MEYLNAYGSFKLKYLFLILFQRLLSSCHEEKLQVSSLYSIFKWNLIAPRQIYRQSDSKGFYHMRSYLKGFSVVLNERLVWCHMLITQESETEESLQVSGQCV